VSTRIVKRFFRDVTLTSSGTEIGTIMGGDYKWRNVNGLIKQIVAEQTSGTATEISSIQIRYNSGDSTAPNLIYSAATETLTSDVFSDSFIDAPFSLMPPEPHQDIILYLQTNATGVFTIRIDLELYV
jgi:hypothetical protein